MSILVCYRFWFWFHNLLDLLDSFVTVSTCILIIRFKITDTSRSLIYSKIQFEI